MLYVTSILCMYICVPHAHRGQKKVLALLELDLQAIVSWLTLVLGTRR